ncbi:anthranilate 1,2-dioxygenase small subunit [Burkholderia glumae]|uniref:Anthranilate 1,2-dioxygenase small subunit n=1 Tax=Burkholderia glumae TaxID=337 RepID=A0AAP9Y489_BURGL|nr:anthranilate 1,2-dioxygenase small subunit [Burkholderia glumae]ACR32429.1 anthranilate 1,2-dioxygenase subunit beta [Burkholderia glumae BGR1]AJY63130.1 anthranilate 1,2-dioxygenase, small subunit [Burkholderia glumae LMG 2196 = ATCC 33617]KHJ62903.1 benzene 1,2-dioxygenase [Burkholderia glumae]MCM2484378.1 anthranilate 1,2-dioxygenase small subunit [Burkholderia glumae]MCM2494741.1 anthranilate 1,2-dioxygenase small subunit [Burkholderia glumae]
MAVTHALQQSVEQFLYRMAELCDAQSWDEYLDLFDENSEYHVPQWDSEHVYTTDPKRGMSLIYYANRAGLEDRVFRLRTGKSAASTPLPRTLHQITNVRIAQGGQDELEVKANWVTFYARHGVAEHFFGRVTYQLRPHGESWKIMRKHVLLLNDTINAVLDFYHL